MDPKTANLRELTDLIRQRPATADKQAGEWQTFVRRYPQASQFEDIDELLEWGKTQNIPGSELLARWQGKEIADAYFYLREQHERDQMEKEGVVDHNNIPKDLTALVALPALFLMKNRLLEKDEDFLKIVETKRREWLLKNPEKANTTAYLDYVYGSLTDPQAPSLYREAEQAFRNGDDLDPTKKDHQKRMDKRKKKAELYDKERNNVHKSMFFDPSIDWTKHRIEEEAKVRYELLKKTDKKASSKDVHKQVESATWERFAWDRPQKAKVYGERHEGLGNAYKNAVVGKPVTQGIKVVKEFWGEEKKEEEEKEERQGPQLSRRDLRRFIKEEAPTSTQTAPRGGEPPTSSRPPSPPSGGAPRPPVGGLGRLGGRAGRAGAQLGIRAGTATAGLLGGVGWPVLVALGVILLFVLFIVLLAGEPEDTVEAGPACPETTTNRNPATCRYLNPAIDLYDTSIGQTAIETYVQKYSPTFVRAGVGSEADFRARVTYIVNNAKLAGLNPVLFLGYWKTESAFSTLGSRDMGCAAVAVGFQEQVDCALGIKAFSDPVKNPVANCAKKDSPQRDTACNALRGIRTNNGHDALHPITYPVDTFDEFAESYGPYEDRTNGEPRNCTHTYNILIDTAIELGKCSVAATTYSPADVPPAPSDYGEMKKQMEEKFGIRFADNFYTEYLTYAWEAFHKSRNTQFFSLVRGPDNRVVEIVRNDGDINRQISCSRISLRGVSLATGKPYPPDLFKYVLMHELSHIIENCALNSVSRKADLVFAIEEEGYLTNYSRNTATCVGGTIPLNEDYADMISYFLNRDLREQSIGVGAACEPAVGAGNPYEGSRRPLHEKLAAEILGVNLVSSPSPTGTSSSGRESNASCPIPGAKINCPSYGRLTSVPNDSTCASTTNNATRETAIGGHCGPLYRQNYPNLCTNSNYISNGNLRRTAKAIDIDGEPFTEVFLPKIDNQSLRWFFIADRSDGVGSTLRIFQSEQTPQGKWTIHFVHVLTDPVFNPGDPVDANRYVAKIAPDVSEADKVTGAPLDHTHVTIGLNIAEPVVANDLQAYDPGWKFPDRELGMCQ